MWQFLFEIWHEILRISWGVERSQLTLHSHVLLSDVSSFLEYMQMVDRCTWFAFLPVLWRSCIFRDVFSYWFRGCDFSGLKHSTIQRFEKDTEDASTTNNTRKITKRFTKHQTQHYTPVSHGRRGLTSTPLEKATAIAEVYEDQFRWNPSEQHFDKFFRQIRREIAACLQLNPVNITTLSTPNKILRIMKHLPKRKAPGHDNIRNIDLRNLPLNAITHLTKIINTGFHCHYFLRHGRKQMSYLYKNPTRIPPFYRTGGQSVY
jgi:hypothetical protein